MAGASELVERARRREVGVAIAALALLVVSLVGVAAVRGGGGGGGSAAADRRLGVLWDDSSAIPSPLLPVVDAVADEPWVLPEGDDDPVVVGTHVAEKTGGRDLLLVGSGQTKGVDLATGKVAWRHAGAGKQSGDHDVEVAPGLLLLRPSGDDLVGAEVVDLRTGEARWRPSDLQPTPGELAGVDPHTGKPECGTVTQAFGAAVYRDTRSGACFQIGVPTKVRGGGATFDIAALSRISALDDDLYLVATQPTDVGQPSEGPFIVDARGKLVFGDRSIIGPAGAGLVVASGGTGVAVFDAGTGAFVRPRSEVEDPERGPSVLVDPDRTHEGDVTCALGTTADDDIARCIDPESAQVLWERPDPLAIAFSRSLAYLVTEDERPDGGADFRITAVGLRDGTERWTRKVTTTDGYERFEALVVGERGVAVVLERRVVGFAAA